MKVLLDTNAYSSLARGDRAVRDLAATASDLLLSPVVLAELWYGFRRGSREAENRRQLAAFLAAPRVRTLSVTTETAERWALVHAALRRKGRPIPTNDLWIAAQALETGAAVLTKDAHFAEVEGLLVLTPE